MMTYSSLVPLPVIVPLVAAGLALALARFPRAQQVVSVSALVLVTGVSIALLARADNASPNELVVDVGGWAAPVGIVLVADRLAALMLAVSSVVTLAVLTYSLGQGIADGHREAPVAIYHPTFLILVAGVNDSFLSGDLFNLFVGFEILLVASFVLLTIAGTRSRIRAGSVYVVVGLLSSVIFLAAIAMIYAATGTVNLAQLAERLPAINPDVALACQLMLLVAFAIKAAVFPLSAWLPDSYPTAPAPVTAVFAGLLTKVGIYAMIRTQTLLFPGNRLADLLMWAALATMIIGILGAVAQTDLKRMLSFTLVSHIGFLLLGVALTTRTGLSATIFYTAHHITCQTALFLVVGMVERQAGTTDSTRMGGLAKLTPLLGILFFVPAMNLAGIPPLSGFVGKIGILEATAASGRPLGYLLLAGSLITSLLTLYAIVKVWNRAFWRPSRTTRDRLAHKVHQPLAMAGSAAVLAAIGVGLAVGAGSIMHFSDRAAGELLDRTPYIYSVLVEGDRGSGVSKEVVGQ